LCPAILLVPYPIGHGLAAMLAGLLLGRDVAGVGGLVLTSDRFPVPLIMLLTSFGLTFASCAMGCGDHGPGAG
jgi:hypothetical protein